MSLRGNCPICGKGPINPTFKDFLISVAFRDQKCGNWETDFHQNFLTLVTTIQPMSKIVNE